MKELRMNRLVVAPTLMLISAFSLTACSGGGSLRALEGTWQCDMFGYGGGVITQLMQDAEPVTVLIDVPSGSRITINKNGTFQTYADEDYGTPYASGRLTLEDETLQIEAEGLGEDQILNFPTNAADMKDGVTVSVASSGRLVNMTMEDEETIMLDNGTERGTKCLRIAGGN